MIYRGRLEEELFNHLKDLDEKRSCEHVKTHEDVINLKIHRKDGEIYEWKSDADTDDFLAEQPYRTGIGIETLKDFFQNIKEDCFEMPFCVLAHYQTKYEAASSGRIS